MHRSMRLEFISFFFFPSLTSVYFSLYISSIWPQIFFVLRGPVSIREFRSLTCLPFTDTEVDRQEKPKKQENNNSVFANEKSSPEKRTNGTMDTSNASMANTPDLSPVKNIRNGEVEDAEVRKTKVSWRLRNISCTIALFYTSPKKKKRKKKKWVS